MKITGKNSLSNIVEICSKVIFVIGIMITITLPFLLRKYQEILDPELNYTPALIILYTASVPALTIVYQFTKIFQRIKEDNPFIMENVRALKIISKCSLIIAIEFIIGIFFIASIFEIVLIGVFIIMWIGGYILAELLRKAIEYKEENELTI